MYKFSFLWLIVILCACSNSNKFTISGTTSVPELEGKTVYLSKYEGRMLINIDSTEVKNNHFSFDGEVVKASLRVVRPSESLAEKIQKVVFILEPGKINLQADSLSTANGTPLNDTLTAYNRATMDIQKSIEQLSDSYNKLSENNQASESVRKKMTDKIEQLEAESNKISEKFILHNLNNAAGAYIYWQNRASFTPEKQSEILKKAGETFRSEPFVQIIAGRLKAMEHVAIGKKFTDLVMQTPGREKTALSQYVGKNKYTLLLFWASWCPSCREEIPHLVKFYAKNSKDIEIIGISFDRDETAWKEGISELKIPFPQMSDLRFWDSEGAKVYAVRAIPHNVLLDKNGIIVGKDMSVDDLVLKLK